MEDLICLLATVRTLKDMSINSSFRSMVERVSFDFYHSAAGHLSQTGPKKCFIPQNCEKYTNFEQSIACNVYT